MVNITPKRVPNELSKPERLRLRVGVYVLVELDVPQSVKEGPWDAETTSVPK
jgi:hypothetical protein